MAWVILAICIVAVVALYGMMCVSCRADEESEALLRRLNEIKQSGGEVDNG